MITRQKLYKKDWFLWLVTWPFVVAGALGMILLLSFVGGLIVRAAEKLGGP